MLLVEDEPAHAELARRAFEARPGAFVVVGGRDRRAPPGRLSARPRRRPTLVIADWRLPDGEGVDLLRGDPAGGLPPVVIMTSHGSERVAVEVMRAGAVDYVVKSEAALADLPHVAERALRQRRIEDAVGDLAAGTSGSRRGVLPGDRAAPGPGPAGEVRLGGGDGWTGTACARSPGASTGGWCDNVEYALDGTPVRRRLDGTVCYIRDGVAEAFPAGRGAAPARGAELRGRRALAARPARSLGLVNAVHDRPLDEVVRPEGVVQVFAARAAAEIERLRAERELERQRVFADSLLDMVASLVIVVDPEGRIVRFNRACEQASGWTEAEVAGSVFWEVLRPREPGTTPRGSTTGEVRSASCPPPTSRVGHALRRAPADLLGHPPDPATTRRR